VGEMDLRAVMDLFLGELILVVPVLISGLDRVKKDNNIDYESNFGTFKT
jgi:hypothetical protein